MCITIDFYLRPNDFYKKLFYSSAFLTLRYVSNRLYMEISSVQGAVRV